MSLMPDSRVLNLKENFVPFADIRDSLKSGLLLLFEFKTNWGAIKVKSNDGSLCRFKYKKEQLHTLCSILNVKGTMDTFNQLIRYALSIGLMVPM